MRDSPRPRRSRRSGTTTSASAAQSRKTKCGTSFSSATRAVTARSRACSPTQTLATRTRGPTSPTPAVRPSRRAAGATEPRVLPFSRRRATSSTCSGTSSIPVRARPSLVRATDAASRSQTNSSVARRARPTPRAARRLRLKPARISTRTASACSRPRGRRPSPTSCSSKPAWAPTSAAGAVQKCRATRRAISSASPKPAPRRRAARRTETSRVCRTVRKTGRPTGRAPTHGARRLRRFPAVDIGGVRFLPQTISYADTKGLPLGQGGVDSYKDITPRIGVAYDVFGNGKTALKVNAGRYLEAAQLSNTYVGNRPSTRLSTTAARNWTDNNKNFAIDCNLFNNAAQSPTTTGSIDTCAAAPSTFGTASQVTQFDTGLLNGWGVRPGDWGFGVSVQQQVLPRVSVEVGYNRRWLDNFTTVDNRDQQASDYTPFQVVAPSDPRLPGGGGQTITGLYNVNPNVVNRNGATVLNTSANDAYNTLSSNYGNQYQKYNGVLLNVSARVRNGLTFQGGMNTGKTVTDYCEVRAKIPEWTVLGAQSPTNPYCH